METSFPFASFEWKQNFTSSVQITEPFRIFWVLEMTPSVLMDSFEYFQASAVFSKLITFYHGYQCFNVNPP